MKEQTGGVPTKKVVSFECFGFLIVFIGIFYLIGSKMGMVNMLNTLMNTAYQLLLETVFYIMAIAVLAGAIAGLMSEFGVVAMINKILSPVMKPIYNLPGAGIVGVLATYMSDNPAILTLADDRSFRRCFKKYQIPALTNIGTAFGMGLIITTFMIGIISPTGETFFRSALIGNIGAIIGSVVSVRLMLHFTKKVYGTEAPASEDAPGTEPLDENLRQIRPGSVPNRALEAVLDGGKEGVNIGLSIIPGVLIICTLVLMLTNGASADGYTGAAYEGIALLPALADKISFILTPLFGFSSSEAIAVPITALGAAGAAIGLVPGMVRSGIVNGGDIAVFTAMCMCWSGYLSTHVAMMSALKCPKLTGKSIFSHTLGGLAAGISAHWIYVLVSMVF